jgi:hypothetical protein
MFPPTYFPGIASATAASAALFDSADAVTRGDWPSVYGDDGIAMAGIAPNLPTYAALTLSGQNPYTWSTSAADPRALQDPTRPGGRLAACWYNTTPFEAALALTDGRMHRVAAYLVDWDGGGARAQSVQVLDTATRVPLHSIPLSGFQAGVYLVWYVKGGVTFRVTWNGSGANAVLSGLFLG